MELLNRNDFKKSINESISNTIKLSEFVKITQLDLIKFGQYWTKNNQEDPTNWPLELGEGDWLEHFILFTDSVNESEENKVETHTLKITGSKSGIENLSKLIEHIKEVGNTGHSFTISCDPDDAEYKKDFGWDGDGDDKIDSIDVEITELEIVAGDKPEEGKDGLESDPLEIEDKE